MNILLITDSYPPEIRSASLMMAELARGLSASGHRISVITSSPRYNLIEGQRPSRRIFSRDREGEIRVFRVRTPPLHNTSHVKRGLAQLALPLIFSLAGFFIGPVDRVIVYSPPLPLGLTAWFLKIAKGSEYIFNVQDLFPQNAIDLGALSNSGLVTFFRRLEKFIYRRARYITVHSPGNKEFIVNLGIEPGKIEIIHNWIDPEVFASPADSSPLDPAIDLQDKFVALFAGVMSYAQDMDIILDAARILKENRDIVFLLVGDGSQKPKLDYLKKKYELSNLIIHPFVPLESYPSLVVRVDVGLVTLKQDMKTPVVPSKILGYMAAGKPVIGSLNRESEAHQIIETAGGGWSRRSDGPGDLAKAIRRLYRDPSLKEQMGEKGKKYVCKNFSFPASLAAYEKLLGDNRPAPA